MMTDSDDGRLTRISLWTLLYTVAVGVARAVGDARGGHRSRSAEPHVLGFQ
jgi:hypothetical protein